MSDADPDNDRADDLTALYRAANAGDIAGPSDAARRSVLAYARSVTRNHATRGTVSAPPRRPTANYSGWRMSAAASVIVASLATLLAWHFRVPPSESSQELLRTLPKIAADNQTAAARSESAAGSSTSSAPSESPSVEGTSGPAPAPNAVTARSSERRFAREQAPRAAPYEDLEAGSVASSRQEPATVARASAAKNATEAAGASDEPAPANRVTTAQLAASAAAPPPANLEARQPPAPGATSAARTGAAPGSALIIAAESGDLERVDQLLRSGIGTEQTDARGRTALLVATLRGDLPMVRRLLAAGARVDVAGADGDTPLAVARRQGPGELERLLERATQQP